MELPRDFSQPISRSLYFKRPASTEADPLVNDERPDREIRAFALMCQ